MCQHLLTSESVQSAWIAALQRNRNRLTLDSPTCTQNKEIMIRQWNVYNFCFPGTSLYKCTWLLKVSLFSKSFMPFNCKKSKTNLSKQTFPLLMSFKWNSYSVAPKTISSLKNTWYLKKSIPTLKTYVLKQIFTKLEQFSCNDRSPIA